MGSKLSLSFGVERFRNLRMIRLHVRIRENRKITKTRSAVTK